MSESKPIRNIESAQPFASRIVKAYRNRGWIGTLPLPPGCKASPPTGYTGREAPFPTDDELFDWIADGSLGPKSNIGVRLGNPIEIDIEGEGVQIFEVLGLDIDDYNDAGKDKNGGQQLATLERKLGPLPPTWRSSSRSDGVSGIRFYLVPAGYAFSGKADKHIDIIQKVHRYAVVYPSWHPNGEQYVFTDPDGNLVARMAEVPNVADLPFLPDRWFDFLTRGGIRDEGRPLDMDSTVEQLRDWAKKTFPKVPDDGSRDEFDGMCLQMRKNVDIWKEAISEDPSSHDKIVSAHWNLYRAAVEGHSGWAQAIRQVEDVWLQDVGDRGKRGIGDAKAEIFRSKTTALRKIKAEWDKATADGIQMVSYGCTCFDDSPEEEASGAKWYDGSSEPDAHEAENEAVEAVEPSSRDDVPRVPDVEKSGSPEAPDKYERNDDGNAGHLMDLYGGNLLWVPGLGQWISWNGSRWVGDNLSVGRHAFRSVKLRQLRYAQQLCNQRDQLLASLGKDDPEYIRVRDLAKIWLEWSRASGENKRANGALEASQSLPGCYIAAEELDANPRLLGVRNGVLELEDTGITLRNMRKEDHVTKSTAAKYVEYDQLSGKGKELWEGYLAKFLPESDLRRFFQKICGYALLGDNRERLVVFLLGRTSTGKSTILNAILRALGSDYAHSVNMSIFRESKLNPELAQALPARIITSSEVSDKITLHADVLKRSCGNDPMAAELKNVNVIVERIPAFLPIIATNNPPSIPGADEALRRRLCVVPFDVYVAESDENKSLAAELAEKSGDAVLSWMAEGWNIYAREGIGKSNWPAPVKNAIGQFFSKLSHVGRFVSDCVEFQAKDTDGKKWNLPSSDLYSAYQIWCAEEGISARDVVTSSAVGNYLASIGYGTTSRRVGGRQVKVHQGMRIVEVGTIPIMKTTTESVEDGSR